MGIVHDATLGRRASPIALTFELTYYNHEIDGAHPGARHPGAAQRLPRGRRHRRRRCARRSRASASGNLSPPNNFLDNLGSIETDGFDFKIDWRGTEMSLGPR